MCHDHSSTAVTFASKLIHCITVQETVQKKAHVSQSISQLTRLGRLDQGAVDIVPRDLRQPVIISISRECAIL